MPTLIINGAQWGDEGKGKLVDCLTASSNWVVRFQGGHNAGHTLVVDGKTTKLSLIPCGILHRNSKCLVAAGVVIRPEKIISEINSLREANIEVNKDRLYIDYEAQLLLEYHAQIDQAKEGHLGENKIGTTGKGIGPAYEDRASRVGIRFAELLDLVTLKSKVERLVENKQAYLSNVLNSEVKLSFDQIWKEVESAAEILSPFLANGSEVINQAIDKGDKVVFEGAQATLLDATYGTFPFVTSSSTLSGAVCTGAGVGPKKIDYVLVCAKAYCTRVGEGPFPTELKNELGDLIRERGKEFGTVTGRPRRCGWLDLVALKRAIRLNSYDSIALMKLDVLSGLEKIKLGIGYTSKLGALSDLPALASDLGAVTVGYESFDGWQGDLEDCRTFESLPSEARFYIQAIEDSCKCKISFVSVGPDRQQIIFAKPDPILSSFWG
jgi:adenylosuccinate synthase